MNCSVISVVLPRIANRSRKDISWQDQSSKSSTGGECMMAALLPVEDIVRTNSRSSLGFPNLGQFFCGTMCSSISASRPLIAAPAMQKYCTKHTASLTLRLVCVFYFDKSFLTDFKTSMGEWIIVKFSAVIFLATRTVSVGWGSNNEPSATMHYQESVTMLRRRSLRSYLVKCSHLFVRSDFNTVYLKTFWYVNGWRGYWWKGWFRLR